jgi:hypothetical protein
MNTRLALLLCVIAVSGYAQSPGRRRADFVALHEKAGRCQVFLLKFPPSLVGLSFVLDSVQGRQGCSAGDSQGGGSPLLLRNSSREPFNSAGYAAGFSSMGISL